MHPFQPPLTVPPQRSRRRRAGAAPDWAALAGPVTYSHDPQAVFATESLAQTLRQLEVYGRDGLPVLSADGQQAEGWVPAPACCGPSPAEIRDSREAARPTAETPAGEPPAPLPGYQLIELTVTDASPAAGAQLGSVTWPPGSIPVAVLRDHAQQFPDPAITLRPGDRISLLAPAPAPAHRTSTPQ